MQIAFVTDIKLAMPESDQTTHYCFFSHLGELSLLPRLLKPTFFSLLPLD